MRFQVIYNADGYDDYVQYESDSFIAAARFYLSDKNGITGGYDAEKWCVELCDDGKVIDYFSET